MNAYQEKWLSVLKSANLKNWEIEPQGDNILVKMPHITDLKVIRDNLPEIVAALSLDIEIPKQRVEFIFENGYEKFEYVINPSDKDLNEEWAGYSRLAFVDTATTLMPIAAISIKEIRRLAAPAIKPIIGGAIKNPANPIVDTAASATPGDMIFDLPAAL